MGARSLAGGRLLAASAGAGVPRLGQGEGTQPGALPSPGSLPAAPRVWDPPVLTVTSTLLLQSRAWLIIVT